MGDSPGQDVGSSSSNKPSICSQSLRAGAMMKGVGLDLEDALLGSSDCGVSPSDHYPMTLFLVSGLPLQGLLSLGPGVKL